MTDANGLYYLRARYYDPDIKRFVNADTYKGKINDSTTLNNYAYANGNPVTLTDPFGKCADGSLNSWGSNLPTWVKLLIGGAVIAALAVATVLTGGIAGAICAAALTGAVVGGATGATIGLVMSTIDGKSISATCNSMADGFMWGTISGGATGAIGEGIGIAGSAAEVEAAEEAGNATEGVGNPIEVLGRGSTGRTIPNTLNEQMSMHEVMSNPLEGATRVPSELGDPRWPSTEGWSKMQRIVNYNGGKTIIHFDYNTITGEFDDFKFK